MAEKKRAHARGSQSCREEWRRTDLGLRTFPLADVLWLSKSLVPFRPSEERVLGLVDKARCGCTELLHKTYDVCGIFDIASRCSFLWQIKERASSEHEITRWCLVVALIGT
mmetsp:Transcript_7032/g.43199  ORF Transcript_7032/g.43199 Transcript_7032/m.43199 type:complete len:111 (+) Transcript_7032:894-1226(+)